MHSLILFCKNVILFYFILKRVEYILLFVTVIVIGFQRLVVMDNTFCSTEVLVQSTYTLYYLIFVLYYHCQSSTFFRMNSIPMLLILEHFSYCCYYYFFCWCYYCLGYYHNYFVIIWYVLFINNNDTIVNHNIYNTMIRYVCTLTKFTRKNK